MITFVLIPHESFRLECQDIIPIAQMVKDAVDNERFLGSFISGYQMNMSPDSILLTLEGSYCDNNETIGFLRNMLTAIMHNVGLLKFLKISNVISINKGNDRTIKKGDLMLRTTHFSKLVESYKITEIPEEFLCAIEFVIMNDPVYIDTHPLIKYEKQSLLHCLFSKQTFQNPFTREAIKLEQIVPDITLKAKIQTFVQEQVLQKTKERNIARQKVRLLFPAYKEEVFAEETFQRMLRKSSATNRPEDLDLIIQTGWISTVWVGFFLRTGQLCILQSKMNILIASKSYY